MLKIVISRDRYASTVGQEKDAPVFALYDVPTERLEELIKAIVEIAMPSDRPTMEERLQVAHPFSCPGCGAHTPPGHLHACPPKQAAEPTSNWHSGCRVVGCLYTGQHSHD